jgi:hypothetical protein
LHCPQASTNLFSIQKFCTNNQCYFILASTHYFVKDLLTHATLLKGRSEKGLYPLQLGRNSHKGTKFFTAFVGIKTSSLIWHFRLGHSALDVVNHVVKDNVLPVSSFNFNKTSSCAACQLRKGRKQPFYASNRVSHQLLKLIHFGVWTSPIQSITALSIMSYLWMNFLDLPNETQV